MDAFSLHSTGPKQIIKRESLGHALTVDVALSLGGVQLGEERKHGSAAFSGDLVTWQCSHHARLGCDKQNAVTGWPEPAKQPEKSGKRFQTSFRFHTHACICRVGLCRIDAIQFKGLHISARLCIDVCTYLYTEYQLTSSRPLRS